MSSCPGLRRWPRVCLSVNDRNRFWMLEGSERSMEGIEGSHEDGHQDMTVIDRENHAVVIANLVHCLMASWLVRGYGDLGSGCEDECASSAQSSFESVSSIYLLLSVALLIKSRLDLLRKLTIYANLSLPAHVCFLPPLPSGSLLHRAGRKVTRSPMFPNMRTYGREPNAPWWH